MIEGLNILYLTHRFPYPPAGGAKVRAFHCIERLSKRNRVTVAAPLRDSEEAAAADDLKGMVAGVLTAPIRPIQALAQLAGGSALLRSASVGYFYSPKLARLIRAHLSETKVDLIVVHSSAVAHYVAGAQAPKVLDFVDIDSRKWMDYSRHKRFPLSLGYALEGYSLARAEVALARHFDLNLVATDFERDTLHALAGEVPASVVRNGVDLTYFSPGEDIHDPERICFIGRMDYFPNEQAVETFCRDSLPIIRRSRPNAKVQIVGAEPTAAVRALERIDGVEVTGTVPDVRPYVRASAVTVAPLAIARGTQNKILESMAMGVPVVASALAARGVDAEPERHLLTGASPEEIAAQTLRVLTDPKERTRLAEAGRARVAERHAWPAALDEFEARLAAYLGTPENREPGKKESAHVA